MAHKKTAPHSKQGTRPDRPQRTRRGVAPRWVRLLRLGLYRAIRFLTFDMWQVDSRDQHGLKRFYLDTLKSLYMTIRGYIDQRLVSQASALTYQTLLSIVPMLAVVVAIAKGFGFQQTIYDFLLSYMPGHQVELQKTFGFVENYLSQVQGGVFLGFGLAFLVYTVFNLMNSVERTFNMMWGVPRGRAIGRKVTDYLTMVVLLPVLMTFSSGITVMMATIRNSWFQDYIFFTPLLEWIFNLVPFLIPILMFAGMFIALPNTRVHFLPAFLSAILAGVAYQVLQALYVSGILWISRYNAIYGGFAAVPLFLLWMQVIWSIILFCAKLSFSIQNVQNFGYAQGTANQSRRYQDFLTILVMGHIVQRFLDSRQLEPHDIPSLSEECHLPIAQTSSIISRLLREGLIIEVLYQNNDKQQHYHPAVDPSLLTVGYVLDRMDRSGPGGQGQGLIRNRYEEEWQIVLASRSGYRMPPVDTLLRDLSLGDKR